MLAFTEAAQDATPYIIVGAVFLFVMDQLDRRGILTGKPKDE